MTKRISPERYVEKIRSWGACHYIAIDRFEWTTLRAELYSLQARYVAIWITHRDGSKRTLTVFASQMPSRWPAMRLTRSQAVHMARVWLNLRRPDEVEEDYADELPPLTRGAIVGHAPTNGVGARGLHPWG
jgi:hypothetical protein